MIYSSTDRLDPANFASTIGKAAIVVLVMFSIPLQIHPCRASLDAVLKWRPNKSGSSSPGGSLLPGGGSSANLAGSSSSAAAAGQATDSHGYPVSPMSDMRFALLTTLIIAASYATALSVSSLDRVLAYVGSTGSTSISFILPGLFYYKISDPDSSHHQRLMKEDDDAFEDSDVSDNDNETDLNADEASLLSSGGRVPSIGDGGAGSLSRRLRRRTTWRWDLEHINESLLRKMALGLAIYGICVMIVCLTMNLFFVTAH